MKNFNTLSEREILALAISLGEEDERVYSDFAEGLCSTLQAEGVDSGCVIGSSYLGIIQSSPSSAQNRCQARDQFLRADFALLIRPTSSKLVSGVVSAGVRIADEPRSVRS